MQSYTLYLTTPKFPRTYTEDSVNKESKYNFIWRQQLSAAQHRALNFLMPSRQFSMRSTVLHFISVLGGELSSPKTDHMITAGPSQTSG